jgi:hypothetical protein
MRNVWFSFSETNPFVFAIFGLVKARNKTGVARRGDGYEPEGARPRTRSFGKAEGAKEVAQKST